MSHTTLDQVLCVQVRFVVFGQVVTPHEALVTLTTLEALVTCNTQAAHSNVTRAATPCPTCTLYTLALLPTESAPTSHHPVH